MLQSTRGLSRAQGCTTWPSLCTEYIAIISENGGSLGVKSEKNRKKKRKKKRKSKKVREIGKITKRMEIEKLKKLKKTWEKKFKTTHTSPKTTVPSCRIVTPTLFSPPRHRKTPCTFSMRSSYSVSVIIANLSPNFSFFFFFLLPFIISTPFLLLTISTFLTFLSLYFSFIEIPPKARTFKPGRYSRNRSSPAQH